MARVITHSLAVRKDIPLLIGMWGPTGCGKTYSALRLAKGIQSVRGGDIYGVDTESNRMKHYDAFKFQHVPFGAPFGPGDYLEYMQYCASKGASVIITDSVSHMHDGIGGVLELHDKEFERLGGEQKHNFSAWKPAKREFNRFVNGILQMPVAMIFCFRAKEKLKLVPGRQPEPLGWCPITTEGLPYELTANCLLPPSCKGIPDWNPRLPGSREVMKYPTQFHGLLDGQLSEDMGAKMARWASGEEIYEKPKVYVDTLAAIFSCKTEEDFAPLVPRMKEIQATKSIPGPLFGKLREAWKERQEAIKKQWEDEPTDDAKEEANAER
jgi:hypothetical protein